MVHMNRKEINERNGDRHKHQNLGQIEIERDRMNKVINLSINRKRESH